jgi:hypothetical protein
LSSLDKAYDSIPPEKAAEYLGLTEENVFSGILWPLLLIADGIVLEQAGWTYNAETRLLYPPIKTQTRIIPPPAPPPCYGDLRTDPNFG